MLETLAHFPQQQGGSYRGIEPGRLRRSVISAVMNSLGNVLVLLVLVSLLQCAHLKSLKGSNDEALEALTTFLFPNRTVYFDTDHFESTGSGRQLAIIKTPYDPNKKVPCARCTGMKVCKILNQLMVEEVYYPKNAGRAETCSVIDSFGKRISGEVFGNGRAFRDTDQCRDIVMQYLCLFYGSDNSQYRNYCVFQEVVNAQGQQEKQVAARPPCRSFCVQVATVCANDETFIQTCNRIACPPTEGACTPDPVLPVETGKTLGANVGCDVPYYRTPYNAAARTAMPALGAVMLGAMAAAGVPLLIAAFQM